MSTADSPIQKETTESFLATVEAVSIVLPYCTELLSKMLCLPLFIQAKVCVCGVGWRRTKMSVGWAKTDRVHMCMCTSMYACKHAC